MNFDLEKINKDFTHINWSGEVATRPCIDLQLYLPGTLFENKDAILDFFDYCNELLSGKQNIYWLNEKGRYKKVDKKAYSIVSGWFSSDEEDSTHAAIRMVATDKYENAATHYMLISRVVGEPVILRLQLPIEDVIQMGLDKYREGIMALTQGMNILYGICGFGYIKSPNFTNTHEEDNPVFLWSRRYLGFDLGEPYDFHEWLVPDPMRWPEGYIKTINWLTFIDHEKIERAGGIDMLNKNLAQGDISVYEKASGVIIQAGAHPEIGDVNQKEILVNYQLVYSALKSLCIPREYLYGCDSIGGEENTWRWLTRFEVSDA